jgi:transcriptional regulator with XRE-family HTH domain
MKLSDILGRELAKRHLTTLKEAARFLGMSTELIRTILNGSRVPKDKNLIKIAERLGINASALILAAHQQNIPSDMQSYLLKPAEASAKNKRIWPLSLEQCDYLAKVMSPEEIQLMRKYRQLTVDEKIQAQGYIHYMFSTKRVLPPPSDKAAPGKT